MKRIFNIRKLITDTSSFITSIITLIVVFFLIFSSVFAVLSLKEYNYQAENKNQIIIYLNHLENEQKEGALKKILEIPGISTLRYESKEIALKAVSLELGVEIPENENPLNDAFYAYLDKNVDLEKLKENLLNVSEISSFDFRTKALESGLQFNKGIEKMTVYAMGAIVIFSIIMIYNTVKFSIISKRKEINDSLESGVTIKKIQKIFFMENLVAIIFSFLISFLIYQIFRNELIKNISMLIPNYKVTITLLKEIVIILAILLSSIAISAFANYTFIDKYFNKNLNKVEENTEGGKNYEEN